MKVVVWVADGAWAAAVDKAAAMVPDGAEFRLVHVVADDLGEVTRRAFTGLLGRRYSAGPDRRAGQSRPRRQDDVTGAARGPGRPELRTDSGAASCPSASPHGRSQPSTCFVRSTSASICAISSGTESNLTVSRNRCTKSNATRLP